jgi:dienelactone hydrolase
VLARNCIRAAACAMGVTISVVLSAATQAQGLAAGPAIPTPDQSRGIPLRKDPNTPARPEQWEQWLDGRSVRNVSNPTLTPVLPDAAKATGVGVIIAPGGAFYFLVMDGEGFNEANWLAERGIAAFVLKYRTEQTPTDPKAYNALLNARVRSATNGDVPRVTPEALEDAKSAIRLVRERAALWHVDPTKVGFLGFSAGAMVALSVGTDSDKASRPDFVAPIYPPMNALHVPADAPPLFLAIALDDVLFAKDKSLDLITSWRNAGRPIEAHLYERGEHGFATVSQSAASSLWMGQFHAWMQDRELLKPAR